MITYIVRHSKGKLLEHKLAVRLAQQDRIGGSRGCREKLLTELVSALVLRYYPSVRVHIAGKPVCVRSIAISYAAVCTGTRTAPFAVLFQLRETERTRSRGTRKSKV